MSVLFPPIRRNIRLYAMRPRHTDVLPNKDYYSSLPQIDIDQMLSVDMI